jgi:hypothetical protein
MTRLQAEKTRNQAGIPDRERDCFVMHIIQTGSGAYPASYPMGTPGLFAGDKSPKLKADSSLSSSAEVRNK